MSLRIFEWGSSSIARDRTPGPMNESISEHTVAIVSARTGEGFYDYLAVAAYGTLVA